MNKKNILNIGGGIGGIPSGYSSEEWNHTLLDIDPKVKPDILCDAKDLNLIDTYDCVHIAHTLEHFYKHDIHIVLTNIYNCLKIGGYIEVIVPDLKELIIKLANSSLDINDVYYRTKEGLPITYHDVIYGWDIAMSVGNLFYAHKCGFTPLSMCVALNNAKFKDVKITSDSSNIIAIGYK